MCACVRSCVCVCVCARVCVCVEGRVSEAPLEQEQRGPGIQSRTGL